MISLASIFTTTSGGNTLPGRDQETLGLAERHTVLDASLKPPFGGGIETAIFALGCFWGGERLFWQLPGVVSTAVGYCGGQTPNPTYEEVCSGRTGHAEAVLVAYDPAKIGYRNLLKVFFEGHNPTQGMRQGNDVGSQYRSAIYCNSEEQRDAAEQSARAYERELISASYKPITTEIALASPFYYAEDYHQQYLDKVPGGYCGLGGTGVACPAAS